MSRNEELYHDMSNETNSFVETVQGKAPALWELEEEMKNYLLHQQQLMLMFGKHTLLAHISVLTANIESLHIKAQRVAK